MSNRREFLKKSTIVAAGATLTSCAFAAGDPVSKSTAEDFK
ncbi:MAG: hypothetical protein ACI8WW_001019, partial [Oceanospirillaceae bacterium]